MKIGRRGLFGFAAGAAVAAPVVAQSAIAAAEVPPRAPAGGDAHIFPGGVNFLDISNPVTRGPDGLVRPRDHEEE